MTVKTMFRTLTGLVRFAFKLAYDLVFVCLGLDYEASPYLKTNFGPVDREVEAADLEITGVLPKDLDGIYVRNGPNPKVLPTGRYHWFDGDGMLHGLEISAGKASYVNRWVRTERLAASEKAGRAIGPLIGEILSPHALGHIVKNVVLAKIRGAPDRYPGGSANTSVEYHAGRFFALVESSLPTQVQLPQLSTVGVYDFDGKLRAQDQFTAHPKVDPVSGEMLFFGYSIAAKPHLKCHFVSKEGRLLRSVDIDTAVPSMVHDFAVSERHVVLPYFPLYFRRQAIVTGDPMFRFEPDQPSLYGIMPRRATSQAELKWFKGPACYMFHTANAWDDGDFVVLTGMRAADPHLLPSVKSGDSWSMYSPRLYMWRFNLSTGQIESERSLNDEVAAEFPTINPNFRGRNNRFVYAGRLNPAATREEDLLITSALKFDLQTDSYKEVPFGPGRYGGEPYFVARAGARDEDDGYLVTYVYDTAADKSDFVVIDAKTMAPRPLASVRLPQRVPHGFHGRWVTRQEINGQSFD